MDRVGPELLAWLMEFSHMEVPGCGKPFLVSNPATASRDGEMCLPKGMCPTWSVTGVPVTPFRFIWCFHQGEWAQEGTTAIQLIYPPTVKYIEVSGKR